MKRFIYIFIGMLSLCLGVIGIILPIIPTTPLLLLTGFCFMKGSTKFHTWFINSKIYEKYLENFDKNKVMTLKSTLMIIIFVSLIFMLSMYFINNIAMTIVFNILILLKCLYFILRVKVVSKDDYLKIKENLYV